jgi:hypothetical protein
MTTIAVHEGEVATDTQLTGGNYAVRVEKLVRLPDGGVAAAAGLWKAAWPGLQWLAAGEKGEAPDIEGATIVIVRPDHSVWLADETFPAFPILERTYALGCGADLARMAMAQGRSPVEAVAEACELDANSSAPILSLCAQAVAFPPVAVHKVRRRK